MSKEQDREGYYRNRSFLERTCEEVEFDDPIIAKIPEDQIIAIGMIANEFTGITNVWVEEEVSEEEAKLIDVFLILTGKPDPAKEYIKPWRPLTLTEWVERSIRNGKFEEVKTLLSAIVSPLIKQRLTNVAKQAWKLRQQNMSPKTESE